MRFFEFGDLGWVPNLYHIYLRRYLGFFYKLFGYYKLWIPAFSEFIREVNKTKFMECCSGSGETLELIRSQLDKKEFLGIEFLLSDIQPHSEFVKNINQSCDPAFRYIDQSVDVTEMKSDFNHPKIFINSFHHFSEEQVKLIFDSNFNQGNEIIIMEYVRNSLMGYLTMLMGPIIVLLTLPFVVKFKHLPIMIVFTYLIPLFPLMMLWDGFVSCLHEYSVKKLTQLVKKLGHEKISIKGSIKRNILYPAGVSVVSFTFPPSKVYES